jgi:hypothetical protein
VRSKRANCNPRLGYQAPRDPTAYTLLPALEMTAPVVMEFDLMLGPARAAAPE